MALRKDTEWLQKEFNYWSLIGRNYVMDDLITPIYGFIETKGTDGLYLVGDERLMAAVLE